MSVTKFNLIHDNYYEFYVGSESHITFFNKHNSLNGYYKLFEVVKTIPNFNFISGDRCISIYFYHMEFYIL